MTKKWVIIERPKNCHYCGNAYYGLQHTVEYAISKGFDVVDISGSNAIRNNIYNMISCFDPVFFMGMGHGNECMYTDDKEQPVWGCISYPPNNLNNRIVYLWSCLTGRSLGPKIIELGGKAYAGFTEEWVWLTTDGTKGDPYDDPYAHCFFESGNELAKTLFDGHNFSDAKNASIAKYNEWINYWKTEGITDPNASEMIKWLAWDRDALITLGDETATLGIPCSRYTTEEECVANECYWCNNTCSSIPVIQTPVDRKPMVLSGIIGISLGLGLGLILGVYLTEKGYIGRQPYYKYEVI